jgi:ADP-heptose:LPS heptosyltransferase
MSFRLSAKTPVKEVLFITLSNIGDVILTMPVFDVLCERFPSAKITVITGPKAESFFGNNPAVTRIFVYDKHLSWDAKWRWFLGLRKERFDLAIDLRHSILPYVLGARVVPSPWSKVVRCHMREKHLLRLKAQIGPVDAAHRRYGVVPSGQDQRTAQDLVFGTHGYVLMAPGAADEKKRWSEEGFAQVASFLVRKKGQRIVLVGSGQDAAVANHVLKGIPAGAGINLCGKTSLPQLAVIVDRSKVALVNDSGVMHLCSYYNIPVVALFGPTDPGLYGPWSKRSRVVRGTADMASISVYKVITAMEEMLR